MPRQKEGRRRAGSATLPLPLIWMVLVVVVFGLDWDREGGCFGDGETLVGASPIMFLRYALSLLVHGSGGLVGDGACDVRGGSGALGLLAYNVLPFTSG